MFESDKWTIATGEDQGKMLIYRIRLAVPTFASKASFRRSLLVLWPFDSSDQTGLPTQDDVEQMTHLENLLTTAFEGPNYGFLTVVITGNGIREWQWYVRDPEVTMEFVYKTLTDLAPSNVQFNFEDDPDWDVYRRFLQIRDKKTGNSKGSEVME